MKFKLAEVESGAWMVEFYDKCLNQKKTHMLGYLSTFTLIDVLLLVRNQMREHCYENGTVYGKDINTGKWQKVMEINYNEFT
jgi:hypothetical protein